MKFDVLSPSDAQVSRMQVRVVEGYDNRPKSLWREWWGMLQARPVKNSVLVAMAAALVLFGSPVLGLLNAAVKRAEVAKGAMQLLQRGYASFTDFDDAQAVLQRGASSGVDDREVQRRL